MSGFQGANLTEGGDQFTQLSANPLGSELTDFLLCDQIVPGSAPSYQVCKTIYLYHPLGGKMAEGPVILAQSQARELTVGDAPEKLIPAFQREWKALGCDRIIRNIKTLSRVYGISSVGVGDSKSNPSSPLDPVRLHELDIYFNVFDPLNTAGSLVLDQDPTSPNFMKPRAIVAGGQAWHPSRSIVVMNEEPIYIAYSASAFGFVGRSVYQRALYPLKSFVQSMVTDDMVTKKIGLLIWKAKAPGSIMNNRILNIFGFKRSQLQGGLTGNVLTVGETDDVSSLNFQNLEGPGRFTRENILKNIATSDNMPAAMLNQETLVKGFGEGSEDAKQVASYIDRVRIEMEPIYSFFDRIVMRRAWSPEFYKTIQAEHDEYKRVPYETAFYRWQNDFEAIWPNLLTEPDSEKAKAEDVKFKTVIAMLEVLLPNLDPKNKAATIDWAIDQANACKKLFTGSTLELDIEALAKYVPPMAGGGEDGEADKEPDEPRPFSEAA